MKIETKFLESKIRKQETEDGEKREKQITAADFNRNGKHANGMCWMVINDAMNVETFKLKWNLWQRFKSWCHIQLPVFLISTTCLSPMECLG